MGVLRGLRMEEVFENNLKVNIAPICYFLVRAKSNQKPAGNRAAVSGPSA